MTMLIVKYLCWCSGFVWLIGAPGEIRTPDQSVRSRLLYPAELRARVRTIAV